VLVGYIYKLGTKCNGCQGVSKTGSVCDIQVLTELQHSTEGTQGDESLLMACVEMRRKLPSHSTQA